MPQRNPTMTRRNPVARATILSKGGVHQKSKSAERGKTKQSLRREVRSLPTSTQPAPIFSCHL
jgi:hypothetical protein